MNAKHLIWISAAVLLVLWLCYASLPYKIAVLEQAPITSYDTYVTSQEFLLKKKLDRLKKSKTTSQEEILDTKEALGNALWSFRQFGPALDQYQEANTKREKMSKGYNQKLIDNLLCLAGIYRDVNRLDDAISCYERIWKLDKTYLPANDPLLARDQSSMAVIAYVCGETQQDEKKHEKYMKNCLVHIANAQKILQGQKTSQTAKLANLYYLKYLALRDLGDRGASEESRQQAYLLNKQMQRPYLLPWS